MKISYIDYRAGIYSKNFYFLLIQGVIICTDSSLASLLGYQDPCEIEGSNIVEIIPSLVLPDSKPGQAISKVISRDNIA